ncbi:MAG TPA: hypothetical protein VK961_14225 [Chthoniobacter sp.]|nr:hypothetical protein [Chthoniobacter sp.]
MKIFPSSLVVVWLCGLFFGSIAGLHAQTDIRPEPGGKRILFVDGDDIRPTPGGKRLLFVDGTDIRPEPGGKRLLCLENDNIRPTPNGIRIALWDGKTLRRTPGGKILLVVDGDDIRPDLGGPRMYFIDGPKLSQAQVTAVLYLLKPELFTLSAAETAAKQKEMADNEAAEDKRLAADQWVGDHAIAGQSTDATTKRTGSIAITKQGSYYAIKYNTGDNPPWQGIGVTVQVPGSGPELWAAVAPGGAASLGIYEVNGGALRGVWVPPNASQDPSVLGFENLVGAPQLGGVYKITSGKLPNGGTAYSGALNIDPLAASFSSTVKCYRMRWSTGTSAIGFLSKNRLAVAAGWGADWEFLRMQLSSASISVDLMNKTGAEGTYTLLK